uniref:Phytanoyl-CoA dioxygenase n=2 Tax=Haptolina brevifila TaxID=156173 RepID=A0A7S2DIC6_9EUKA|mmetsp:Transcript_37870/g.75937  ORF Transcript_37870/g.75937 Transcript_37870/m.75937 type:complete len:165 (+) Transcript_37870:348-842(+)
MWSAELASDASAAHPVTLWVALDAVGIANGGMEMAPGLHRTLLNEGLGLPRGALDGVRTVEYALPAGHAGLHHPLVPHRSHPNRTDEPRRAFLVRFSPRTALLERQCGGPLSEARARAAAHGWLERPSRAGRYMWVPGNANALAPEPSMNRVYVCCRQSLSASG